MSSAILLSFDSAGTDPAGDPVKRIPVSIDPLAVAVVEHGWRDKHGSRVVLDSGKGYDLTDEYELVVKAINDARAEFAKARREQVR